METIHGAHIDEKIPAVIVRATGRPLAAVTARRFMGVLLHPVPPLEMQRKLGRFEHGGKIYVDWPEDPTGWRHVEPGDEILFEDRQFSILAIEDFPHCFSAIYAREDLSSGIPIGERR